MICYCFLVLPAVPLSAWLLCAAANAMLHHHCFLELHEP